MKKILMPRFILSQWIHFPSHPGFSIYHSGILTDRNGIFLSNVQIILKLSQYLLPDWGDLRINRIPESLLHIRRQYGFYAVATNLDDSAKDILEVSTNRYKIEDCFRMMKTNFSARPVFHQKRERIIAHFMICYTALLIYRLMEKKLDLHGTHYTADTLIETMKSMDVANIEDMCYMSTYTSSEACTALNAITGLGLDKKYYQPKELNKKIKIILK